LNDFIRIDVVYLSMPVPFRQTFRRIMQIPPEVLLSAYAQGVFPMAHDGEIQWFSPQRRGLIPLDGRFHIPHGLKRALKRQPFEIRRDTAFREVMLACADRDETWIDEVILESYCHLHQLGHAHSVECWDEQGLQGGLYGVELRGAFFGESMFSRKTDASKIALVALVDLRQFGGYELTRRQYHAALAEAFRTNPSPP
jgi:leucyl/phenylalanyl-tRNA--protein transferase